MKKKPIDWTGFAVPKKGVIRLIGAAYTKQKIKVFLRDRYRCRNPECRSWKNLDIHHKPRRSQGGSDIPEHMFTVCAVCHRLIHDGKLDDGFLK